MIHFNATCPNGHVGMQWFYKDRLRESLDRERVQLWCAKCDAQWELANDGLEMLRRLLIIHG